jgi:hypothetical protein
VRLTKELLFDIGFSVRFGDALLRFGDLEALFSFLTAFFST